MNLRERLLEVLEGKGHKTTTGELVVLRLVATNEERLLLNVIESDLLKSFMKPVMTPGDRIIANLRRPVSEPPSDQSSVDLTPEEVSRILADERQATDAELSFILDRLQLSYSDEMKIRESLVECMARKRQALFPIERQHIVPIHKNPFALPILESGVGICDPSEQLLLHSIVTMAFDRIRDCPKLKHRTPNCTCWGKSRDLLSRIFAKYGPETPMGTMAGRAWAELERAEKQSKVDDSELPVDLSWVGRRGKR